MRPRGLTEAEAFAWFMPGEPPEEGCWDWTGATTRPRKGYGKILMWGKRTVLAHHISYRIYKGPIPTGLNVLHSCDRGICVQPAHLHLGTLVQNSRQMVHRRRMKLKLSEADVLAIRSSTLPQQQLADIYGINGSNVSRIRTGKRWGWIEKGN